MREVQPLAVELKKEEEAKRALTRGRDCLIVPHGRLERPAPGLRRVAAVACG